MARVYTSKTKGLRIATRCGSLDQFIAAFHRACDAHSFFVPSLASRPVGLETAFSVDLANGTPVLRGRGVVMSSWTTSANPFKRPGVQIGVRRLTRDSERVFEQLLIARAVAEDGERKTVEMPPLFAPPREARTPGSAIVLPANPLAALTDDNLDAFIECTLHEDEAAEVLAPTRASWWARLASLFATSRLRRSRT